MEFEAGGKSLITLSYDGQVRSMDVTTGQSEFVVSRTETDDGGWLQSGSVDRAAGLLHLADSEGYIRCFDRRQKAEVYRLLAHSKKVNTVHSNPTASNYLATASLDRTVKIWDARQLKKGRNAELAILPEPGERSINSAAWSPDGQNLVTVSQSNYLRLYSGAHTKTGDVMPDHSCYHDNKTGRYLAVFHATWDPKMPCSFVIGSMSRPRQVEIYSAENATLRRVMSLQDPDYLGSVQSRNAFHPTKQIVVCANSSGRVSVFK